MALEITPLEELEDALARMPIRWEKILTKSDFEEELTRVLLEVGRTPTLKQIEEFWEAAGIKQLEEEHGIRVVEVTYPWGEEIRFAIQGLPGLWGRWAVEKIREEEEW